jgi:hypothetical protein
MEPRNGTGQEHHVLEEQLGAFKDGVTKLIDRIVSRPAEEPSRFKAFTDKATEAIKEHPIAAAAVALGLGYLLVRIVRR